MVQDASPLWISLKTAGIATGVTFFLGIAAAYWMLGYRGRWKSLLEGVFISPLILPPTVVGFLLLWLLGKNGPIGKLLLPLNFNFVFTWYAAVVTAIVVSFPLMYKTTLGALEQIDTNLQRAAKTLGASEVRVFWRITFPLTLPSILAGTTLAFARALGEFGATLMLAGNIPGQTETIPMAIYFAVEGGDMQEAWFWSLVILAISLSGITAVDFWRRRNWSGARQGTGNSPLNSESDGLQITPNFSGEASSEAALKALSKIAPLSAPLSVGQQPVCLIVDIQKRLAGFQLNVSFTADQQALGMLGASGAGKSLILRCIAGIETPDAGRIVLNGRTLFDSHKGINVPSRDRQIGFLFQNYALFPHLTAAENIAFGLPTGMSKLKIRQEVAIQLASVQLQGVGDRYPRQLSGGQQQRVALARALASQPEALLLDEPFSALDTHLRSQIEKQMIARLTNYQGITLFVTHNLEEAYRVCQNLLVLERGRAIAFDSKHQIFARPQTVSVAQLTGCKNFSRAVVRGQQQIEATDWDCILQAIDPIPENLAQVGIRAHQVGFLEESKVENQKPKSEAQTAKLKAQVPTNAFPGWLAQTSETPHRITLYLKLNSPPKHPNDYHLQAEVFKEKWLVLKDKPFPWLVQLDPTRLILMQD